MNKQIDWNSASNRKERRLVKYKRKALEDAAKKPDWLLMSEKGYQDTATVSEGTNGGTK